MCGGKTAAVHPAFHRRHGERCLARQCADEGRKLLVLLQRRGLHALHRQQTFLPVAVEEQAFLRAVTERHLVVLPASAHALAQAQFFEKILHLVGVVAGHRQVVCAEWAGNPLDLATTAVAARLVFEFEQRKVVHPGEPQRPRGRQASDAAARDHHLRAMHHGRLQRRAAALQAVTQRMAAIHLNAGETAFQRLHRRLAGRQQAAACKHRAGLQKLPPLHRAGHARRRHHQCATSPHSCS